MRSQSFVPNSFIVIVADINVLTLCQPEKRKKGREGASKEVREGGREGEAALECGRRGEKILWTWLSWLSTRNWPIISEM